MLWFITFSEKHLNITPVSDETAGYEMDDDSDDHSGSTCTGMGYVSNENLYYTDRDCQYIDVGRRKYHA